MSLDMDVLRVPVNIDTGGNVTIGNSGVELASVIGDFQAGFTAEEIVERNEGLNLSDAYLILAYYLRERRIVESYLKLHYSHQVDRLVA